MGTVLEKTKAVLSFRVEKWIWKQIKGAFFALPLMLLVFGLYHGYLIPHRVDVSIQGTERPVLLIAIIIVSVFLHEVIHGIGWLFFGKGRACRIVFQRKGFLLVCKCRILGTSHYLAGRLLPLWTMGTAGIIGLFICTGNMLACRRGVHLLPVWNGYCRSVFYTQNANLFFPQ